METLRSSKNEIVKILFLNALSKTGNLTVAYSGEMPLKTANQKSRWGAALVAEKQKSKAKVSAYRFEKYQRASKPMSAIKLNCMLFFK